MTARLRGTSPCLDVAETAASALSAFVATAPTISSESDVAPALAWVTATGRALPRPGGGATARRWEMLGATAAVDVATARVLEPHADALAILDEARDAGADVPHHLASAENSWGVFAAEGSGTSLRAARRADGRWSLTGTKPWCSLAGRLSHALVTAWIDPTTRRLFAVDLTAPGVHAHEGPWVARGLPSIVSAPVDFDDVTAAPVGDPGWYLSRPGFAWGGMGVAAVWWGGALPLADALHARAGRADADQVARVASGRALTLSWTLRATLAEAARLVDDGAADPAQLAGVVRAVVHDGAHRIRDLAVTGLGPGPMTVDDAYARRVADLELYLLQHHGVRDLARLSPVA